MLCASETTKEREHMKCRKIFNAVFAILVVLMMVVGAVFQGFGAVAS